MAENPQDGYVATEPTRLNYGPSLLPADIFPTVDRNFTANPPQILNPYKSPESDYNSQIGSLFSGIGDKKDYLKQAAPLPFNAEALNFDRFLTSWDFDQKGFIPWQENDQIYNQDSNFLKEMYRSTKWSAPLFVDGFASGLRTFPDLVEGMFTGNLSQVFSSDDYLAQKWDRANRMGMSSKGGMSSFVSGMEISLANMAGTLTEMAVEDAVLSWVTAASFGTAAPVTAPYASFKFGKAMKSIYQGVKNLGNVMDMFKEANAARKAFEITTAMRKVGNFLNPLENTVQFGRDLIKGEEFLANAGGIGKTVYGFGSFYRDLREVNFALTEAKLEGGFNKLERRTDYIDDYQKTHDGFLPTGKEAEKIENNVNASADLTTQINLPVIYYTNRLGFGNLFKQYKPLSRLMNESSGRGIFNYIKFNSGKKIFEEASQFSVKRAYRYGLGTSLNYFKENIMEGVQESLQDVITGASKDYYDRKFNNPSYGGLSVIVGDVADQFGKKVMTAEGAETFASGFLMGSLVGGAQKIKSGVQNLTYRFKDKEGYKTFKENRKNQIKSYVNQLNEIYADPLKFFDPTFADAVQQGEYNKHLQQAALNGNNKLFQDIKDQSVYDHLYTMVMSGKSEMMIDRLNEFKQLQPEEFKDALGVDIEDPENFKTYIDTQIQKVKNIQDLYDRADEKLVNPVNISAFKKGTKEYETAAIQYITFENARKQALFANYSFMRNGERMVDLMNKMKSNSKLFVKGTNYLDFSILMSPDLLKNEIKIQAQEIQTLISGDAEARKIANQKSKFLKTLIVWKEAMDSGEAKGEGKFPSDYPSLENPAYDNWRKTARFAFERMVDTVGNINNDSSYREAVEDVFLQMMDYYTLNQENEKLVKTINVLADPKNFLKLYDSHYLYALELYRNREQIVEKAIRAAVGVVDENDLINKLFKAGFIVDPTDENNYIRVSDKTDVDPASDDYQKIQEIIKDHNQSLEETPPVEPTDTTQQQPPTDQTDIKAAIEAKRAELDAAIKIQEESLKKITIGTPVGGIEELKVGSRFSEGYNADIVDIQLDDNFDSNIADNNGQGYDIITKIYEYGESKDGKMSKAPKIQVTSFNNKEEANAFIEKKKIKNEENKSKLGTSERINRLRQELADLEKSQQPTPPSPPPGGGDKSSVYRIYARRINSAGSVNDLTIIATDISKKGVARGLTSDELKELEDLIKDRIQELSLKEKEESEKGEKYYKQLLGLLNKARTIEDLNKLYSEILNLGRYVTQEQLTEIEDKLNVAYDKLEELKKQGKPQILTPEDSEETELTEDEFRMKIEEAESLKELTSIFEDISKSNFLDQKTKMTLTQMIHDKSTTFVSPPDSSSQGSTVNDVFDLSNIDSMNAADFSNELNDLAGLGGTPPVETAIDQEIKKAEDDMFDDISSCNINP
jgi:hypothetical protein